jgi:benzoate-CoA ligase family protein
MMGPTYPERFNMAGWFLDRRSDEGRGDHLAVIDDAGRYRYRDVEALANRVAHALWARGVRPEDRVLIALTDRVEFAAAFFGILKIGAVVAMVNPELPDGDYAHYLSYTRCRALLAERELAERLRPLTAPSPLLRALITVDGAGGGGESWDEAVGRASPERRTDETHKDDPAVWLFTSGSTGKPKAAVHLHHDFPYNTECYARQVLQIAPDDRTVGAPKLFFGYATGTNVMFPFAAGATTILFRERATPEKLFSLIAEHQATVLTSVPTMIGKMLAHPQAPPSLAPLRVTLSAGEALPPELSRRYTERFGCPILDGIGSAEMFHIYISNRLGEARPGSLGQVVPGYEARVVGPDGHDAPDGEIGTLWVKGDSAAICYWQAHERSKEVLRGDWVVSGDLFRRDAEGFFYYAGRADDLLKVGGIWVSPVEVEAALMRHPDVLEAAVIGYEDEEGLVKPMAYVVPRPGVAADGLGAALVLHCRAELAHYKAPRRIELVAALPRSDRGKILRRALGKEPA